MKTKTISLLSAMLITAVLELGDFSVQTTAAAAETNAASQSDPMQFARGTQNWRIPAHGATTCESLSRFVTINGERLSHTCAYAQV